MKSLKIIVAIVILSSFSLCYSQDVQEPQATQDKNEGNYSDVEFAYIIEENNKNQVQSFGQDFPENSIYRRRIKTENEFIFKTYIMEKLLKSNRILY